MKKTDILLGNMGFNAKSDLAEAIVSDSQSYYHTLKNDSEKYYLKVRSVGSSLSQYLFSDKKVPANLQHALINTFSRTELLKAENDPTAAAMSMIEKIKKASTDDVVSEPKNLYGSLLKTMQNAGDIVVFSPNPPELLDEKFNMIFVQVKDYIDLVAEMILRSAQEVKEKNKSRIRFHYYIPNEEDGRKLWNRLRDHLIRYLLENKAGNKKEYIKRYFKEHLVIEKEVNAVLQELNGSENIVIQAVGKHMTGLSVIFFDYIQGYTNHGLKEGKVRLNEFTAEDVDNFNSYDLKRISADQSSVSDILARDWLKPTLQRRPNQEIVFVPSSEMQEQV